MNKRIKTLLSICFIAITATLFLVESGCNKNDGSTTSTPNTNPGCGEGVLCGKLDGLDFASDQYTTGNGTKAVLGSSSGFSTLILTALRSSTKETIGITFTQKPQTGHTYSTSSLGVEFTYINVSNGTQTWTTDFTSHTGSVTVTKFDTTANLISGTFNFTAGSTQNTTTHTFSNGAFTDVKVIR
jgi:hypothetical protein